MGAFMEVDDSIFSQIIQLAKLILEVMLVKDSKTSRFYLLIAISAMIRQSIENYTFTFPILMGW